MHASMWWVFAGFVATFAVWPFLLALGRRQIGPAFHATIAVQLILAGVIGSMVAIDLGAVRVSVGNIAFAAVIMTTAALFAATRELRILRDAVALVVAVNTVSLAVLTLTSAALEGSAATIGAGVDASAFALSIPALIVGTGLHIFGLSALVWIMERARHATRSRALVAAATLLGFVGVLLFDGFAFPLLSTWWEPALAQVLPTGWDGVSGKLLLGVTFGIPLTVFLAVFQQPVAINEPDLDLRALLFVPRRRLLTRLTEALATSHVLAEQLAVTMNRVTDGVVALDGSGNFSFVNAPAAALLDLPSPIPIGQPFAANVRGIDDNGTVSTILGAADAGKPATVVATDSRSGRSLELRSFPGDGSVTIFVRDVTDELERRQQLERIAEAEQHAANQLRQLDQLKNSFLTAVSHELRTPLTVVRGLAETIERSEIKNGPALTDVDRLAVAVALVDNTERLSRLLDDLLDLDRLLRGASVIARSRHDVVELARQVLANQPDDMPARLVSPDRLYADIDRIQIERILTNLLTNAAKYAEGTEVTVTLSAPNELARIEVHDHGPGVPRDQLEQIFEPFHRSAHAHPQPGTGIGLALVREFAALHGGRAWAVDTNGNGAHIVVEFPRTTD